MRTALRLFFCLGLAFCAGVAQAAPRHAIAMHGEPKYAPGFKNFDYVNPDAPKGGELRLSENDTFDNLNPFILKGIAAAGLARIYDTLMVKSSDEPLPNTGSLAESVDTPPDRSWVTFTLRPEARFHDGKPITVDDVIFTFETLRAKGHPFYRFYYSAVAGVKKTGDRSVKFTFKPGDNRELPLILGQTAGAAQALLAGPSSSTRPRWSRRWVRGPYKVTKSRRAVPSPTSGCPTTGARTFRRCGGATTSTASAWTTTATPPSPWRPSRPGDYDFRQENTAKVWATGYDFPPSGRARSPASRSRTRTPRACRVSPTTCADRSFHGPARARGAFLRLRLRIANKQLFYGAYTRTRSYFSNTELASSGLPAGEELKILEKYRGRIPDEVFTRPFEPPLFQADEKEKDRYAGALRENLRKGRALLESAGWKVDGSGKLMKRQGRALQLRDSAQQPGLRTRLAALREEPGTPGNRGEGAHGGRDAVPEPHGPLRLRHGGGSVRPIAVAGQRAARLLGLGQRRYAGGAKPHRHQGPGGGRTGEPRDLRPGSAEPGAAARGRSTACCSGATTSSPTGTCAPTGWRTGTSSDGPRSIPPTICRWTRGGRRNKKNGET